MNRMIEKETSAYVYYYHYLHAFSIMFSSTYVALHMRTPYLRFDSIKRNLHEYMQKLKLKHIITISSKRNKTNLPADLKETSWQGCDQRESP
jgi:hypothetical protein